MAYYDSVLDVVAFIRNEPVRAVGITVFIACVIASIYYSVWGNPTGD